ncbi:unnamed protein product [Durusdinium trenchii]|uniref:Uncharacterized protein n=1 Tax=Durusdinium trenchii TaxID=1381693 RepID=A0ABP0SGT5_9DINO
MAKQSLPDALELGFVALKPRVSDGMAELVLQAADNPFTEEGVTQMTDYIDVFLEYKMVKKGFSIVYDLRLLRVPSLTLVKQLADWGRDPVRQQTFQRLNRTCKVVVSEGWRMGVAKRILRAFFTMCPPVCDTYLLTAIDQPASEGMYFAPPQEAVRAAGVNEDEHEDEGNGLEKAPAPRSYWLQSAIDFLGQPSGPHLVHAANYCPSFGGPHA